jgi:hypothetical protein
VASSLNLCDTDREERVVTQVIRKTFHTFARTMRRGVHIYRVPTRLALVGCVMAAAIPVVIAFTRDVDAATPTNETPLAVATPAVVRTPAWTSGAAHSASMLVVGTLLIGAAAAIRRAA